MEWGKVWDFRELDKDVINWGKEDREVIQNLKTILNKLMDVHFNHYFIYELGIYYKLTITSNIKIRNLTLLES